MRLEAIINNRNRWFAIVFAAYIVMIFAFAGVYYALYRGERDNFVFASDIVTTQRERFRDTAASGLPRLEAAAQVLRESLEAIRAGATLLDPKPGGGEIVLSSGYRIVFGRSGVASASVVSAWLTLTIQDPHGQELLYSSPPGPVDWPKTRDDYVPILQRELDKVTLEAGRWRTRLHTLSGRMPDVWSFWDFVYFSAISQATVGYGDIIPNSTPVRMLVVTQVLMGYLFLVVVINLVVGERPTTTTTDQKPREKGPG